MLAPTFSFYTDAADSDADSSEDISEEAEAVTVTGTVAPYHMNEEMIDSRNVFVGDVKK